MDENNIMIRLSSEFLEVKWDDLSSDEQKYFFHEYQHSLISIKERLTEILEKCLETD